MHIALESFLNVEALLLAVSSAGVALLVSDVFSHPEGVHGGGTSSSESIQTVGAGVVCVEDGPTLGVGTAVSKDVPGTAAGAGVLSVEDSPTLGAGAAVSTDVRGAAVSPRSDV